uniref:Uncharacterized protein n=1 Tax=Tetraselmis chuii TaxID=63592 RepID=A0A7S1SYK8_9CHLO|mmetsp:Transcript_36533/g.65375  ORF Transcript_36533/g.65375 Transcript_36533/m.65375 type:complete len:174 (+) Transcript_36533:91-612(+)
MSSVAVVAGRHACLSRKQQRQAGGMSVRGPLRPAPKSGRPPRRTVQVCRAALDSSVTLAVTQQLTALGVYVGAEAGVSLVTLKSDATGRPFIPIVAAGIVGLLATAQIIPEEATTSTGLIAGSAICAALMAYSAKRALDTKHDPAEWPGPKAWPVSAAISSLFGLVLCLETLF